MEVLGFQRLKASEISIGVMSAKRSIRKAISALSAENGSVASKGSFDYDHVFIGASVGRHGAALHAVEKMKPLPFQTPKPSSTRSRSKETPQSKRWETGSSDPKILSKSSASNLFELTESDASDSGSSKSNQQKIVPKSLNFEFESVSEDLAASASDPPLLSPDLESSVVYQDLTSWISPGSGKIVVSVENPEAVAVTDLLKESILEFKSSAKVLDALRADVGGGQRKSGTGRWSDGIFWMKMQAGLSLFLIVAVTVSNLMVASEISVGSNAERSFTGLYPT